MLAVIGLERAAVAEVVARVASQSADPHSLVVANDNAPGQVVVSGLLPALEAASAGLRAAGARRVIPLKVSGPFHSPHMTGVGAALAAAFEGAAWNDAAIPVVSNVTAEPLTDATEIRGLLARQVSSPVEWVRSVQRMAAEGVDTFIECGPGGALSGMVHRIAPQAATFSVSQPADLEAALEAVLAERVTA
jgi:[acyl-carrier-protein] S-malonyltransferase